MALGFLTQFMLYMSGLTAGIIAEDRKSGTIHRVFVGCGRVREGMGISGMKERVQNLGGNLSISAESGFTIVCMLYREPYLKRCNR